MQYQFDKQALQKKLEEVGATQPCHRCGHPNFAIIDGATNIQLQDPLNLDGGLVIGGASMPVVYVACGNCGAITAHAIGALELVDLKGK